MSSFTRLRAHAGLWSVVAVLGLATVFVAASAEPATTRIADASLQQMVSVAAYPDRDLITVRAARPSLMGVPQTTADQLHNEVVQTLPAPLAEVRDTSWAYQRTSVSTFEGIGASLTGDGVTSAPQGFAPVVSFHYQPGLIDEVDLIEGEAPVTDVAEGVVEVMVAEDVAAWLGLEVGGEYALHPGRVVNYPDQPGRSGDPVVRVSGVFVPHDPDAQVWQHAPLLLRTGTTVIPADVPPLPTTQATLVTDEAFFDLIFDRTLTAMFEPDTAVRVRFDESLIDAAWVPAAIASVAQLYSDIRVADVLRQTGLADLLRDYQHQAASAQALVAVTATGIVAVLLGLLLLAARLIADRRRSEVALLRARGGSVPAVTGRLTAEALWLVPLAAAAGWILPRLALGEPLPGTISTAVVAPGAAALVALLIVPAAGALVARRSATAVSVREDTTGRRSMPARLTVELSVIVLAALGVVLMHQRGLSLVGVDPYLSAVPVLLALAGGLLALRLFPWPVRLLAAAARRLRGVVGFVGLARLGRGAPGTALALLVLVLSVAVGGFAGAVNMSVSEARDRSAMQEVGAHIRVESESLSVDVLAAVAELPGVTTVVPVTRGGMLTDGAGRARGASIQGPVVVAVDTVAYQELLAELEVDRRLPAEVVSARPGAGVPALAGGSIAARQDLVLHHGEQEQPLEVVGDVAGLPGPDRDRNWVLVPRQALTDPAPMTGLLVNGADVDVNQVRQVVAELSAPASVAVFSVAEIRAELEASGFNEGLTLVFVAGTVGGAVGGVLAVTLALVLQARARGRVLSLLRTMGLSSRQARGLLLVELLPVTALAVAVGAVVGIAMPLLLAPALGLGAFTGGVALGIGVDTATVAALAGLVGVLVVAGAGFEAAINRRLGIGRVLRVD
jgi:putative ABC transport system permease protein